MYNLSIKEMKKQGQFRYSQSCLYKCIPLPNENIYDHQDQYNVRHQYIRDKHFDEHFKKYGDVVKRLENKLEQHRDDVLLRFKRIKEQIDSFEDMLSGRMREYFKSLQMVLFQSQEDRRIMEDYQLEKYGQFTCKDMHRLITMTDMPHLQPLQQRSRLKIDQHIQDIEQQMQSFLTELYEEHRISIGHPQVDHQLNLIKLSESSIKGNINESMMSEGLMDFKAAFDECFQAQRRPDMAKKKLKEKQQQDEEYENLEIVEDDHDMSYYQRSKVQAQNASGIKPQMSKVQEKKGHDSLQIVEDDRDTSYYLKNKKSAPKDLDLIIINPKILKPQEKKQQSEITKAFTDRQSQWSKQDQYLQQNQQQMMKEIHSTQAYMDSSQSYLKDSQDFIQKISNLQYIAEDIQPFNIRVKVVRVLYFCVVSGKYFKMKFIAGDDTGLAVFFTNYSKVIKPDVQLELTNCKIKRYKESLQVNNDKHFRQINPEKGMIKVDKNGYIFSKGIETDMYYRVYDKNCQLIREVAQRLHTKNNFTVPKMVVQVVFILNEWTDKIFCQVGDSSGLMLAYIKKDKIAIKEGDVVSLSKITARKGLQPNKLMDEDIVYLDSCDASSKISPFRYGFLEISESIMSA